ncbi:MAG TPA: DUF4214 domain-containing protein, partial [Iamia sp.]|nr:DUF4214 domain-containing protein [Iamia sp.]
GDKIVFQTTSTNLGGKPATAADLYEHSREYGYTQRANVLPSGNTVAAVVAGESSLDRTGLHLVFTTTAGHVYYRSLYDEGTVQVDVSSAQVQGNSGSKSPAVSDDGKLVAFTSHANNLVPGDTNFAPDVFVRDWQAGTTTRVSLGDDGQANLGSGSPSLSQDGRYVAFTSDATNLVGGDTNQSTDVFWRDRQLHSTYRVSVDALGGQAEGASGHPAISGDGAVVTFESTAPDLDGTPANATSDIFQRWIADGTTNQVGRAPTQGTAKGGATRPATTWDGRVVAFLSTGNDLVAGDTNGLPDAFVARNEVLGPFLTYAELVARQLEDFSGPQGTAAARTADLVNGRVTPTHLITTLAHAPAWAKRREPVIRLYQAFFHRQPDLAGLTYWVQQLNAGAPLYKVAASFSSSPEFKAVYGNVSNGAFVGLVYGNVLQRKPDAAGLAYWTTELGHGLSRGDLMTKFSESAEGRTVLAPQVDPTLIGLGLLGVIPSKALHAEAALAQGNDGAPEVTAGLFLESTTYVNLVVYGG